MGRVSIVFEVSNVPGSLYGFLERLKTEQKNISCIRSRPATTEMGEYVFYIEVDDTSVEELEALYPYNNEEFGILSMIETEDIVKEYINGVLRDIT